MNNFFLSATDLAIALAHRAGTLRVTEQVSSFGLGTFAALEDDHGLIEVQNSIQEAWVRVAQCVA